MESNIKENKNLDAQEASTSTSKWNKPMSLQTIARTYINTNSTLKAEPIYKLNVADEKTSRNEVQVKGTKKRVRFDLPEIHHDTVDENMSGVFDKNCNN